MFGLNMINEMDNLHREMDSLFKGFGIAPVFRAGSSDSHFMVEDTGEAFQVKAVLPGLDPEKLDISILGRRLTVAGEYRDSEIPEGGIWHRKERSTGQFERTLLLSANIDADKIEADYQLGELQITLPKAASAMPRKISVKAP
jgi:HSP20 family protein